MNRRINRAIRDLDDENERRNITKKLAKAQQEKLLLQQKRNDTGIEKSVANKRKAKDLWQKANPHENT